MHLLICNGHGAVVGVPYRQCLFQVERMFIFVPTGTDRACFLLTSLFVLTSDRTPGERIRIEEGKIR